MNASLPWAPQIGKPRQPPQHRLTRLKESHHFVAKLFARGLTAVEVARYSGYTAVRCNQMMADPLFTELVVAYRNDPATQAMVFSEIDLIQQQCTQLALKAQRHLADRFEELEDAGEVMSTREALPVFTDMADRVGVSRRTTQVNINADFAAMLDQAIKRTEEFLGTTIDSPTVVKEASPTFIAVGPGPEVEFGAPSGPAEFVGDLFEGAKNE